MRLYFLKTTDAYRKGFVHEIPDDEAKTLVSDGIAQEAAPGQRHDFWCREEPEFPPGLDEHLDEIYKRMTHLQNENSLLRYQNKQLRAQIEGTT